MAKPKRLVEKWESLSKGLMDSGYSKTGSYKEIARRYGVSYRTVYNYLNPDHSL